MFLKIKGEITADMVWKKLTSIHANKGRMYKMDLLSRLQNMCYTEGESMRDHLTGMTELKERLAEMSVEISDQSFVTYIRTSLSLTPTFRPLFIALSAAARKSEKPLTSSELIWHLTEEATSTAVEDNINKSNAAMATQQQSQKGKGKGRESKSKDERHCTNCSKDGHTKDQCWEKGGGKEGQGPCKWWEKSKKKDESNGSSNANTTNKAEMTENMAFTTIGPSCEDDEDFALTITSDFSPEAHSTFITPGVIIDSGATAHFSPNRSKFLNYQEITPEPIQATDRRTFNALVKGDIKIELPMGNNEKLTPVLLKDIHYSPNMAFTIVSVSQMDRAGLRLLIQGGNYIIRSPGPNSKVVR